MPKQVEYFSIKDVNGSFVTLGNCFRGPMTRSELAKQALTPNYQPTFGEIASLLYASAANRGMTDAETLIGCLKDNLLIGRTAVFVGKEGIYVDDNAPSILPDIFRLDSYERSLLKKLEDSREEDGVKYSEDGSVRYTDHGFTSNWWEGYPSTLAKNRGIIALVGNKTRAQALIESLNPSSIKGLNWESSLYSRNSPEILVPFIGDSRYRCGIGVGDPKADIWHSFEVSRSPHMVDKGYFDLSKFPQTSWEIRE